MSKTMPFFKLATSAVVGKRRNPTLSYDPRYPQKTELRKSPQLTASAIIVVKPWLAPASRAAFCNLSESNVLYWNCPSLAGWSPQQLMQTRRASIGKVGDVLKLSFRQRRQVNQGLPCYLESAPIANILPKGEIGSHTASISEIPFSWA